MASPARTKRRNAAQLAAEGFAALVEKLGMAEAIRYVQLYDQGEGDYTVERHSRLNRLGNQELVELMAKAPKKPPRRKKSAKHGS